MNDEPVQTARRRRELDNERVLAALRRQPEQEPLVFEQEQAPLVPEQEQAPLVPKQELLFFEKWREYRSVVGSIAADLCLWAIILAVLVVYHYLIENADYPHERKEILETVHFRMSVSFLVVSSLGLILKVGIHQIKSLLPK